MDFKIFCIYFLLLLLWYCNFRDCNSAGHYIISWDVEGAIHLIYALNYIHFKTIKTVWLEYLATSETVSIKCLHKILIQEKILYVLNVSNVICNQDLPFIQCLQCLHVQYLKGRYILYNVQYIIPKYIILCNTNKVQYYIQIIAKSYKHHNKCIVLFGNLNPNDLFSNIINLEFCTFFISTNLPTWKNTIVMHSKYCTVFKPYYSKNIWINLLWWFCS